MAYGAIIKAAREQRGWTQLELAERMNASTGKISRWENDSRHKPGIDDINRLSTLLPISADVLIQALGINLSPPAASRLPRELLEDLLALDPGSLSIVAEVAAALLSHHGNSGGRR